MSISICCSVSSSAAGKKIHSSPWSFIRNRPGSSCAFRIHHLMNCGLTAERLNSTRGLGECCELPQPPTIFLWILGLTQVFSDDVFEWSMDFIDRAAYKLEGGLGWFQFPPLFCFFLTSAWPFWNWLTLTGFPGEWSTWIYSYRPSRCIAYTTQFKDTQFESISTILIMITPHTVVWVL